MGSSREALPWEAHSTEALRVPNELKQSLIPGAGVGRFFCQSCPEGTVIKYDPIISVSDFLSAAGKGRSPCIVRIDGAEDLDALVGHFATAASHVEDIYTYLQGFVGGVRAERTDDGVPFNFIAIPPVGVNHGRPANVWHQKKGDHFIITTAAAIAAGDEMLTDYAETFVLDEVAKWFREHKLTPNKDQSYARPSE